METTSDLLPSSEELRGNLQLCVSTARRGKLTREVQETLLEIAAASSTPESTAEYLLNQVEASGYKLGRETYKECLQRTPSRGVLSFLARSSSVPRGVQEILCGRSNVLAELLGGNRGVHPEVFLKLLSHQDGSVRNACGKNRSAMMNLPVPLLLAHHQRLLSEMLIGSAVRVDDPFVTEWTGSILTLREVVLPVKVLWKENTQRVLDYLDDYEETDVAALAETWEGTIPTLQEALDLIER